MRTEFHIPIVEIYGILLVPIQVALTDELIMSLKDDVSHAIQRTGARGLIIDLSGVDVLDSYLSHAIHQICSVARLMGVHGVISGMNAAMAMTLVQMGLSLQGVNTVRGVEDALEYLHGMKHGQDDEGSSGLDGPEKEQW